MNHPYQWLTECWLCSRETSAWFCHMVGLTDEWCLSLLCCKKKTKTFQLVSKLCKVGRSNAWVMLFLYPHSPLREPTWPTQPTKWITGIQPLTLKKRREKKNLSGFFFMTKKSLGAGGVNKGTDTLQGIKTVLSVSHPTCLTGTVGYG